MVVPGLTFCIFSAIVSPVPSALLKPWRGIMSPQPNKDTLIEIALDAGNLLKGLFKGSPQRSPGEADIASQVLIAGRLHSLYPHIPILVEEQDETALAQLREKYAGILLLVVNDTTDTLPPTYFSVDPLDGSIFFESGCPEFAVSIGYVENYVPLIGAICMPMHSMLIAGEKGKGCTINSQPVPSAKIHRPLSGSMIGLDICKAVPRAFRDEVLNPLIDSVRFFLNHPSVASGADLITGKTRAWVSGNARNWDVAATACLVEAWGGGTTQLNGSPIPWDHVRMPPLLFTDCLETALAVLDIISMRE